MKTGTIKTIEPAIPPTYESAYGTMNSYRIGFADGTQYKFAAKGDFKKNIGDTIEFEVTNEQYKNAKMINNFKPMKAQERSASTNDSILLQVCYKENMQSFAKDNKDIVIDETIKDFNELKQFLNTL